MAGGWETSMLLSSRSAVYEAMDCCSALVARGAEGLAAVVDGAHLDGATEVELHVLLELVVAREGAETAFHGALERLDVPVQTLVSGQIPGRGKTLAARLDGAHVGFSPVWVFTCSISVYLRLKWRSQPGSVQRCPVGVNGFAAMPMLSVCGSGADARRSSASVPTKVMSEVFIVREPGWEYQNGESDGDYYMYNGDGTTDSAAAASATRPDDARCWSR
ncbi:hypothetical protein PF005_g8813 [Phytophthora fragariae]|uniref:Uncharacterized protein n=1 Tax=Phytophthora fragariae TaxID=53985 RepID=A0A6A3KXL7_9STRA|nr:hypothetical protein PF009_g10959 [Phytophthora fragariae]KAE9012146.1 hypothetical protein PF011_g9052 [Phytophthora fragariae]KAE9114323.1 hypothetical protein PF007_g10411 [Phytophthora fragariae]KAE9114455.1 hypothetical protein PF010_g9692 [Phytophthora fragariae]KAE9217043.1 hypothetical protein PF005_g8813 [Phytophthora fragariae]